MKFTMTDTGTFKSAFEFGELTVSGNAEIGFRPFQLLVASIGGCTASVFRKVLEKKRIAYTNMEFTAAVERNPDEADKVTKISIHFIVTGEGLSLEQIQKSLAVASKNCSMSQSVKGAIEIVETVEVQSTL